VGTGRVAAVADTGPLIHLAEIKCLDLFAIFAELHIPEGVWREAERPPTIRLGFAPGSQGQDPQGPRSLHL